MAAPRCQQLTMCVHKFRSSLHLGYAKAPCVGKGGCCQTVLSFIACLVQHHQPRWPQFTARSMAVAVGLTTFVWLFWHPGNIKFDP